MSRADLPVGRLAASAIPHKDERLALGPGSRLIVPGPFIDDIPVGSSRTQKRQTLLLRRDARSRAHSMSLSISDWSASILAASPIVNGGACEQPSGSHAKLPFHK